MFKEEFSSPAEVMTFSMPSLEEDSRPKSKEEVQKELEELTRKAYEEGFSTGEQAGFAEGKQKAEELTEHAGAVLDELTEFKKNMVNLIEGQVVDLSTAMARKIIADEIRTRPDVIVNLVRESLKRLQLVGSITVKINPALHEMFRERRPELTDLHEDIVFDVSSAVAEAGPLVISGTEEVVTDVDSLVANIVEEMQRVKEDRTAASDESPGDVAEA